MIDLKSEELIPLSQVPFLEFMPRRRAGSKLALSTLYRWANRGSRGRRLETFRVGGAVCTTLSALERFFSADVTPVENLKPSPILHPVKKLRQKGVEQALDQLGIGVSPPSARSSRKSSQGD